MEAITYNQTGKEEGKINLPERIFGLSWNAKAEKLIHQVAISMMANARVPIAHTKNRGEVSGTGKKPWRQKGTGRARHGSKRSPIWVGGGVAHGPRNEKDFSKKINKKMKQKALFLALSKKLKDNEIILIKEISIKAPKTSDAKSIIMNISKIRYFSDIIKKKKNAAFLTLADNNQIIKKSFSNFGNVEIGEIKDLNVLDVLNYKYLVMVEPEKILDKISYKIK